MKIITIVLIVFVVVGLVKLNLNVLLKEEKGLSVILKILFLKFTIFSSEKNRQLEEYGVDVQKKQKKYKKKGGAKNKRKNRKGFFQKIEIVKILIEPIPKLLKFLNRGFKIKKLFLFIQIAKEDAQKTALEYVKFSSLIYGIIGLVDRCCKIKEKNVSLSPNFLSEKSSYSLILDMNISIGRVIAGILFYVILVLNKFFLNKK